MTTHMSRGRPSKPNLLMLVAPMAFIVLGSPSGGAAIPKASSASRPPASAGLQRPLHLPRLKPGESCPVSRSHTIAPHYLVTGNGPAFLITNSRTATISLSQSQRDSRGWLGQKTPWAIARSYDGPLLVRGARIDRKQSVRFALAYGQHLKQLRWPAGVDQGNNPRFRALSADTLFRSPGCYAYQADGTSFSSVVVVRVVG
jgi:hypothetical protein